jgi:hypothetical protein
MRKCKIIDNTGMPQGCWENEVVLFHGFYQGVPNKVIDIAAVVEFKDGTIGVFNAREIKFMDKEYEREINKI